MQTNFISLVMLFAGVVFVSAGGSVRIPNEKETAQHDFIKFRPLEKRMCRLCGYAVMRSTKRRALNCFGGLVLMACVCSYAIRACHELFDKQFLAEREVGAHSVRFSASIEFAVT